MCRVRTVGRMVKFLKPKSFNNFGFFVQCVVLRLMKIAGLLVRYLMRTSVLLPLNKRQHLRTFPSFVTPCPTLPHVRYEFGSILTQQANARWFGKHWSRGRV